MHSGYGFAIGNVAAFDMADPQAVVSPGGVGFDIKQVGLPACLPACMRPLLVLQAARCMHVVRRRAPPGVLQLRRAPHPHQPHRV